MAINEKATTIVDVDGKNAAAMLDKLTKEAKELRDALRSATKAGDLNAWKKANSALKTVNKDIQTLKKSAFDTTKVLKNLNGTNLKDLSRAKKVLIQDLQNLNRGTDEYTRKAADIKKVTTEIKKVKGEMFGASKGAGAFGKNLKSTIGQITGITGVIGLAIAMFRKFISVVTEAIRVTREWETTFTNVLTLLDEAQKAEFGDFLEKGALDLMADYGLAVDEVNDALFLTISAGIEAANAIDFMQKSTELAIAGNASLIDVVDGATNIIGAYGDAAGGTTKILNAFFAAQVKGKTDVGLLAKNIGKVASSAKAAGIPVNELFATFAGATKFMGGTEEAATGLAQAINALISPSEGSKKAFADLGIETGVTAIKNNGLLETLLQVADAYADDNDVITELIPNIRAFRTIAGLSAETVEELKKNVAELNDVERSAALLQGALNEQMETADRSRKRRRASWNRLMITIGGGESIFKRVGNAIRNFFIKRFDNLSRRIEVFGTAWDRFLGRISKDDWTKALTEIGERYDVLEKTAEQTAAEELKTREELAIKQAELAAKEAEAIERQRVSALKKMLKNLEEIRDADLTKSANKTLESARKLSEDIKDLKIDALISDADLELAEVEKFEQQRASLLKQLRLTTLEVEANAEKDLVRQGYVDGLLSYEEYQMALQDIDIKYRDLKVEQRLIDEEELIERREIELEELEERRAAGLISQTDFEKQKLAIVEFYANEEEKIQRGKLKKIAEMTQKFGSVLTNILSAVSSRYTADKNKEIAKAEETAKRLNKSDEWLANEKDKINKKAAKKQKTIAIIQAIINTAIGVTQALAGSPPPASYILAALTGVLGAVEIATISSQQFAKGKYPVVGADDGRSYNANISRGTTGVYSEPTYTPGFGLYGEAEPEMVIDGKTFRNIQMNTPELINSIMAHRTPQYAEGDFSSAGNADAIDTSQLQTLIAQSTEVNNRIAAALENPPASMAFIPQKTQLDLRDQLQKFDEIEADASRG